MLAIIKKLTGVAALEEKIEALSGRLDDIQNSAPDDLDESITDLVYRIQELEGNDYEDRLDNLESQVSDHDDQLDSLTSKVTDCEDAIEDCADEGDVSGSIEELDGRVDDLEAERGEFKGVLVELAELRKEVKALRLRKADRV